MGGDYLRKFGDQAKIKKHAPAVESAGATFLPAAFSVLGAWGAAITKEFRLLWKAEVDSSQAAREAVWPVIQRKMLWRAKIWDPLISANAQMLLSARARCQGKGTCNPQPCARAPCARCSDALASHRALRRSARRTTAFPTAANSVRTNEPSASRPTPLAQRSASASGVSMDPEGIKLL